MELGARLRERAVLGGVPLPDELAEPLLAYYHLLQHWNEKINLTSLANPDEAIDRLLLEPIAAANVIRKNIQNPENPENLVLVDLGSGGGSPAVPLALALRPRRLVMVESRSRKAAFLREVARELTLAPMVEVEQQRFEQLCDRSSFHQSMDLVSVRAVRIDAPTLRAAAAFLRPGGCTALFRGPAGPDLPSSALSRFVNVVTTRLLLTSTSRLTLLRRT
jgi:16S rRNA (guanine527-N7)-methyltransferase